jgi:branched-chain amino acid aminotransferase
MGLSIYNIYGGGEIVPVAFSDEATSLNLVSRLLPGGVYTTFRTYQRSKVLSLEEHFQRLEESASLLDKPVSLDRRMIRRALRGALDRFANGDARIRLTVDLEQEPGRIYLALEGLAAPTLQEYSEGVVCVTCRQQRKNPRAKQTTFISVAENIRRTLPPGVHEGLIVDEKGVILEGLSSNFFGVRAEVLYTAAESVLSGITRSIVLEAARASGIALVMEGIRLEWLPVLEEAFITSSTRGVLPVREIDQYLVGKGKVGLVTQTLGKRYAEEIFKRIEEI